MVESMNGVGGPNPAMARKLKSVYHFNDAPPASDSVSLSSEVMRLRGVEGIRFEKVMAVKREMDAGTYMTPEKLDLALDRALSALFGAPTA